MIAALIFDFDGTVLDTESADFQSLTALYAAHGHQFQRERWLLGLGTQGGYDPWAELELLTGRALERATLAAEHHQRYLELVSAEALRPGVRALIEHAAEAGLALAVASSSSRRWVSGHLERLGLLRYFAVVRTREDVAAVKPAPDLFLSAAAALGVAPEHCLVIEDSPNGLLAAQAAGMRALAVPVPLLYDLELPPHTQRLATLADLAPHELIRQLSAA